MGLSQCRLIAYLLWMEAESTESKGYKQVSPRRFGLLSFTGYA
jgi:hypothetical protein